MTTVMILDLTPEQFSAVNEFVNDYGQCSLCTMPLLEGERRALLTQPHSEKAKPDRVGKLSVTAVYWDCYLRLNETMKSCRSAR